MDMESADVFRTTYYSSITTLRGEGGGTGNYSKNVNHRSRYACCDGVPSMLWVVDDQPTDDEWKEEKEMGTKNGYGLFLVSTSVLSVQLTGKENTAQKKSYVQ